MSMKDLAMYHAMSLMYAATYGMNGKLYSSESQWSTYDPPKLKGFTQVKGRKKLSKNKRKQLKTKKNDRPRNNL